VSALVEREMRGRRPLIQVVRTPGYRAAVDAALRLAVPGDVILVLYEKLGPMLNHLEALGAVPADSAVVHAERLPAHPARAVARSPRAVVSP
jgi:cyanophycin synthetase